MRGSAEVFTLYHKDVLNQDTNPRSLKLVSKSARYYVDTGKKLVSVKFEKKLTVRDIEGYVRQLQSHPRFQPGYAEIVDLTEVEDLDLRADEFLKLADEIDPFSPDAKRAFIVRNSVQNHAARMHKVLRTQRNIEIFRSVDEAELWIAK
jgi:hypothetical protein